MTCKSYDGGYGDILILAKLPILTSTIVIRGGAAGMFGGFWSAVQIGVNKKVHCILCLAENAIGPAAMRNDDILAMYSGKTVEVNNCDAEGRLVLADGVAHATKHIENLDLVVDMATLTGAQLVATG